MEVKEIKTLDDIVLAYKKGQLLRHRGDFALWGIDKFKLSDEGNYSFAHIYCVSTDAHCWYSPRDIMREFDIMLSINTYNNSNFMSEDYINEECFVSNTYINENNKENKMENYIQQLIQEHKELVPRINNLHAWVYGGAHEKVDAAEFANEAIQLRAMKVYEEALRARLINAGVNFVDGEYLISIDHIEDEKENHADND